GQGAMQGRQGGRVVADINLRQAKAKTGLETSCVGGHGVLVGAQGLGEIVRVPGKGALGGQTAGFRAVSGNGGDRGRKVVAGAGRHGRRLNLGLRAGGGFRGSSWFAGKPAQGIEFLDEGSAGRRSGLGRSRFDIRIRRAESGRGFRRGRGSRSGRAGNLRCFWRRRRRGSGTGSESGGGRGIGGQDGSWTGGLRGRRFGRRRCGSGGLGIGRRSDDFGRGRRRRGPVFGRDGDAQAQVQVVRQLFDRLGIGRRGIDGQVLAVVLEGQTRL